MGDIGDGIFQKFFCLAFRVVLGLQHGGKLFCGSKKTVDGSFPVLGKMKGEIAVHIVSQNLFRLQIKPGTAPEKEKGSQKQEQRQEQKTGSRKQKASPGEAGEEREKPGGGFFAKTDFSKKSASFRAYCICAEGSGNDGF